MKSALNFEPSKKTTGPENPYLAARREWDERYGEHINRAKNWRFMAMLSGLVALVAVAGIVHQSTRSKVVPFVVALDSMGRPSPLDPPSRRTPQTSV